MAESGFKDYDMPAWSAVFVPAKTPEPIRAKLEGWFNEITRKPETKEFLARQAADPLIGTAKTVMDLVRRQTEQYRELAKAGRLDAQ
jgi:tripartite-type tricarboxylate transporter receptor subunit TctC